MKDLYDPLTQQFHLFGRPTEGAGSGDLYRVAFSRKKTILFAQV
jgi:hypothetical protein